MIAAVMLKYTLIRLIVRIRVELIFRNSFIFSIWYVRIFADNVRPCVARHPPCRDASAL
jgi:hypothetical protein